MPVNMPVEYFGPFGWTSSYTVTNWFDAAYDEYVQCNPLKLIHLATFHGPGKFNRKHHNRLTLIKSCVTKGIICKPSKP